MAFHFCRTALPMLPMTNFDRAEILHTYICTCKFITHSLGPNLKLTLSSEHSCINLSIFCDMLSTWLPLQYLHNWCISYWLSLWILLPYPPQTHLYLLPTPYPFCNLTIPMWSSGLDTLGWLWARKQVTIQLWSKRLLKDVVLRWRMAKMYHWSSLKEL